MPYRLRTRIAPTPSGPLHLGNAWSFALTWLAARSRGGHVHLRIDDLDAARFRDEHLDDIFESLRWLGLDWDSGPRDASEFKASGSQRLRLDRYHAMIGALDSRRRVYACGCSREQIRQSARSLGMAVYPGTCRDLGLDPKVPGAALRYRIPAGPVRARDAEGGVFELHPDRDMGDFILRGKSGDPAYQIASLADDEEARVNFIVRGLDLLPSTGAQLSLAGELGLKDFGEVRFWHHSLILDDTGAKLSKSQGAESLAGLRARFSTPGPVYRFFASALGLPANRVSSARDLLADFKPERVSPAPLRLSDFRRTVG